MTVTDFDAAKSQAIKTAARNASAGPGVSAPILEKGCRSPSTRMMNWRGSQLRRARIRMPR